MKKRKPRIPGIKCQLVSTYISSILSSITPIFLFSLCTHSLVLCYLQFYVLILVFVIHENTQTPKPVTTSSLWWYHGVATSKLTTKKKKNFVYEIYTWLHMNIMRAFFTYVRVISLRGTIVSRCRSLVTLSVTNWVCKFSNFMAGQWVDQDNDRIQKHQGIL